MVISLFLYLFMALMMIISLEVEEKKKLKKDRSFQKETIKYEIVFVIERNSYS